MTAVAKDPTDLAAAQAALDKVVAQVPVEVQNRKEFQETAEGRVDSLLNVINVMLGFSLPAPFIIPLFADVGEHGEYISTTLSVQALLSIVMFAGIAVFSLS